MTFCSFVMSGVLSNAEAGRCAPRTNSAPGLGSRFSLMTPSVRSSVDYCKIADKHDREAASLGLAARWRSLRCPRALLDSPDAPMVFPVLVADSTVQPWPEP